ncbi:VOC family protein [Ensifer sp. ENS05]|uniref:VOC family protein n=1 Tax=Ensifer sp. ENS05 TaxID=2769277 RepID=UPI00177ED2BA|nr:VOC family protein [Ensifer sp. ENS05]MBD9596403.1 VOC family protein [Ensifer sp. ENS05]
MSNFEGLDHIDIVVADIERMAAFFQTVGFTVVRRTEHGGGAVELRFPGPGHQPILELTSARDAKGNARPLGLRHMALRSADIQQTFTEFSDRAMPLKGGPRQIAETGRTLINLADPEGGTLQIVDGKDAPPHP